MRCFQFTIGKQERKMRFGREQLGIERGERRWLLPVMLSNERRWWKEFRGLAPCFRTVGSRHAEILVANTILINQRTARKNAARTRWPRSAYRHASLRIITPRTAYLSGDRSIYRRLSQPPLSSQRSATTVPTTTAASSLPSSSCVEATPPHLFRSDLSTPRAGRFLL